MPNRTGKCTNFGLCTKADSRETQSLPDTADFLCGECKRPLTATGEKAAAASGLPIPLIIGGLLLLLLLGAGFFVVKSFTNSKNTTVVVDNTSSRSTGTATTILRLSGSNTIGAQLVPALVEAWLATRGVSGIHRETTAPEETRVTGTKDGSTIAVEIKAHGSGTAFTALGDGSADIGMSSRKIKSDEAATLQSKGLGDLTSNADERVLGLDGVAIIVNESNPVDSMTIQEVAAIFTGSGSGKAMNIYARDDKSGTYDTFKDRVLGSKPLTSTAKRFEDSKNLADAVARDSNGIGFVGLPYATGAKVVAIAERGAASLVPNVNTIRTESYALSRRLYLYLPDNAKPEAREFARFALDTAGQEIVDKNGFVGQKVDVMTTDKDHIRLMPSADRLSVDLRFRTGSAQLDPKAVDDIKRIANSLNSQFNGRGLMLSGFADSTGNPAANVKLSKDRAEAVAEKMKSQGVTPVSVTGFGQELPVADNGTPEGREKNRRVEVWLRK